MTSERPTTRRYLRVYFEDLERDHPDIWYDPTCLSTFVRLLALSEKAWPAMPDLPRSARRADLAKLLAGGMIEYLSNDRFVLRGWLNERTGRSERALDALHHRKDRRPTSVPTDVPTSVPSNGLLAGAGGSPSSSTSTSSSEEGGVGETPDPFDAYWSLTTRYPKGGGATWLERLTTTFGAESVIRSLAVSWTAKSDISTLLSRTEDALLKESRVLDLKAQTAQRLRLQERRQEPRVVPDKAAIDAEIRRILEHGAAA